MKKKELMRRLSAISMAAMMTVTMVPSNAYAADEFFSDVEVETSADAESEEATDAVVSDADDTSDADIEVEEAEDDTADVSIDAEEEESEGVDAFSDGTDNAAVVGETTPAADATVHMTVSVAGVLADAKDGTAMAERDVTVKDLDGNGILTYDEALSAAHDEYYEGGAAAGYASADSQYGLSLTKLWGDTSGAFGYWLNDGSCNGLSDEVKADDNLTAFVYKDATSWSDSYTKFGQKEYLATAGKAFTVSVDKASYDMESYKYVFAAYEGAGLTAYDSEYKPLAADAYSVDGYNVTFNQAGTYYLVTAGTDNVNLVPAVAKVTVSEVHTGTCGESATWTLENGVLTISGTGTIPRASTPSWDSFKSSITSIVIEEGITGFASSNQFMFLGYYYTALKSVVLPKGMTDCSYLFSGCNNLETVTVGSIGKGTFNDCKSLRNITIQPSVTSIPEGAFYGSTALETITVPEGVTEIGANVFANCTLLKDVNLPSTLNEISAYSFSGCTALEKININSSKFVAKDDIVYTADMKKLLFCPPAHEGKVEIPAGVTEIADGGFTGCVKVTEVTFPEGLTTIGEDGFSGCESLKDMVFPETVMSIGANAFNGCTALTEVKLPSMLKEIPQDMFYGCTNLKGITIPVGVTEIGKRAFRKCSSLESVALPEGVTSIGTHAFAECSDLTEFRFSEKLTSIPANMLLKCQKLEKVYIPAGVKSIGTNAFSQTTNCLKYVLYAGTPEQWAAISGAGKPNQPSWSKLIVLYGCKSIGDSENNAPVIKEQPEEQGFALNEDATDTLKVKAEELKDNEKYYITWFKNAKNATTGGTPVTGTMTADGLGSTLTPATDTRGNNYYYCIIEKVDAFGAATWTYSDTALVVVGADLFSNGSGIEKKPYELATADDLLKLKQLVKDGNSMANTYFKLTDDITLPEGWTPIGETIDGTNDIDGGKNLHAFSGILDGNGKTITVPEGGLPLIGYVQNAEVRNLNIYGKKIAGYGLVNNLEGVGLSGSAVVLDNITLKSGSSTLKSGLIGTYITTNIYAGTSTGFETTIRNCTIEKDVVIGYDKNQSMLGSFAGRIQGTIENCVSHATVYGVDYVGGIIGTRDHALGGCFVSGCEFDGVVEASGQHAGGIVGGGYENSTAPNGVKVTIRDCTASGSITGADKVGGILGGDSYVAQAWNPYKIVGNSFTGKVQATGGNASVGGIIGYYDSLNKFDNIVNNYYSKDCGADRGIGFVKYVDTNCTPHEETVGEVYINTENGVAACPEVTGCSWRAQHNRTDDPLGADADKLANTVGVKEVYVDELQVSGDYKKTFYLNEELDLDGIQIKAVYSDSTEKEIDWKNVQIRGYDNTSKGEQNLILKYEEGSAQITVKVMANPDSAPIKVSFTLLGDEVHGASTEECHTLDGENLITWVETDMIEVDANATVYQVMKSLEEKYGFKVYDRESDYGTYIYAIEYNNVTLAEFDNGQNSGWMDTINDVHPNVGVAKQYLNDGDVIVFHYTDDYMQEDKVPVAVKTTKRALANLPETADLTLDNKAAVEAARKAYDALTDEQKAMIPDELVKKLEAVEARMKELHVHSWDAGKVTKTATCKETGEKFYTCTECDETKTEVLPKTNDHKYVWKTTSKATVFAPEKQQGKCSVCGKTATRDNGKKLTATIKLNATSIKLQKKQTTNKIKVTMANGDSVKSWTTSNKKIVTVDKKGVIKAGKKTGTAKITVTLKSGKKATLKVKVQTAKVKTTKLSGLKKNVTLKKGKKLALKPVVSPLTSQEKVTYTSSNKKVATVSSKGVITAKKKGTVKIRVRSGKKSYVVTVKVK